MVKSFEDLRVWQEAMALAESVYAICKQLPKDEMYGLASQMKRSAVSIASNIAEGSERNGSKELLHFLYIAKGSLAELQTQVMLARRIEFIGDITRVMGAIDKLSRGLSSLIKSIQYKS